MARRDQRTTTERGYGWRWQQIRRTVLERDGYTCYWCHRSANTVDHLHPTSKGGGLDYTNLVASCGPCNYSKGARDRPGRGAGRPRPSPRSRRW
jgi:5-methylcytosine-specific restriction endonuclease McrA